MTTTKSNYHDNYTNRILKIAHEIARTSRFKDCTPEEKKKKIIWVYCQLLEAKRHRRTDR